MACLGVTDGDWRALAMAALEVGSITLFDSLIHQCFIG